MAALPSGTATRRYRLDTALRLHKPTETPVRHSEHEPAVALFDRILQRALDDGDRGIELVLRKSWACVWFIDARGNERFCLSIPRSRFGWLLLLLAVYGSLDEATTAALCEGRPLSAVQLMLPVGSRRIASRLDTESLDAGGGMRVLLSLAV